MLNSLMIKNFRMLEDFTVEKLGRVNLIVGKNNSGKSTVLEAIRIYAGYDKELIKNMVISHDEQHVNSLITNDSMEKKIEIRGSDYATFMEVSDTSYHVFRQPENSQRKSCAFIPTQFVKIEELERDWSGINLTDNEEIVAQALQIIRPDFKRLAFDWDEHNRWVKVRLANEPKPVPLKRLGDGMLRILQIAIKLVSAQGGFLLIDEFENGLHYSVQENVWRLLFEMAEKLDIQVFATTHSWDCIESFAKVALEKPETEGVLFRMGKSVGKSDYGKVISTIFSGDELSYITQSNMEIR